LKPKKKQDEERENGRRAAKWIIIGLQRQPKKNEKPSRSGRAPEGGRGVKPIQTDALNQEGKESATRSRAHSREAGNRRFRGKFGNKPGSSEGK